MRPAALIAMNPEAANDVYGRELIRTIALRSKLLHSPLAADELAKRPDLLSQAEVIFSGWGAPLMDEAFLSKAARLQAVFFAGEPASSWLTDALWQRRVHVSTAANANAASVADYTAAMIAFILKHSGATTIKIGFIPFELVARLTMQRLKNDGIEFLAHDSDLSPEQTRQLGVAPASLMEIFEQCDVISAHAPLSLATGGLIGQEHFAAMKYGAAFINAGQGPIVRQSELAEVLAQRPDIAVALDLPCSPFSIANSRLADLPNVTLTPQIADALGPESRRLGQAMLEEFERWRTLS